MATRLHSPATLGERDEQAVLRWRKLDILTVDRNTVCTAIDLKRTDAKHVRRWLRCLRDATKDSPDSKHELLRAERLGQVVIGAER